MDGFDNRADIAERQRLTAMDRINGEIGILREFAIKYRTLGDNLTRAFPADTLGCYLLGEWRNIEERITRLTITFGELEKQEKPT